MKKKSSQVKPQRIALCGFADTTRHLAPVEDPSWSIWGCNHLFQYLSRIDVCFEMHDPRALEVRYGDKWPQYREWLNSGAAQVYSQNDGDFTGSLAVPKDELTAAFGIDILDGDDRTPFSTFKSTLSWMLALAITQRPKEIGLFGIDMAVDSEWFYQRSNFSFFVGWARGAGITISQPKESPLFKEGQLRLYGYDHRTQDYAPVIERLKTDLKNIDEEGAKFRNKNEALTDLIERLKGAKKETRFWMDSFIREAQSRGEKTESIQEKVKIFEDRLNVLNEQLQKADAEQRESLTRAHYFDGMRDRTTSLMQRLGMHNRGEMVEM